MTMPEYNKLQEGIRTRVLQALQPADTTHMPDLVQEFWALQRTYPERPGKGVRGLLTVLSCLAHGGREDDAMTPAAALELFQNWVLVHDDVEDDSDTRRGLPALHKLVGAPVAINVGDAMHVAMWRLLMTSESPQRDGLIAEFLDMIERTAEGQHMDLSWIAHETVDVSADDYLNMVQRKTGYYTVSAPLRLGAIAAGVTPDPAITQPALQLGAAFQIRDDVLSLTEDHEGAFGKTYLGDLVEGKRTLVLALALERLEAHAQHRLTEFYKLPPDAKTDTAVADAFDLLESSGAIGEAQRMAEAMADEAIETLAGMLPHSEATDALIELFSSLAHRTR
jgi:geranylgeranyl diphosphate synthase type II